MGRRRVLDTRVHRFLHHRAPQRATRHLVDTERGIAARRSGYQGESGMKARASADAPESQRRALLARMAATRAELSASNHVVGMTGRISGGSSARHALMRLPSLGGSTGAAIAVVLAGFAVLGPRRLLATIVRAGLISLIGRMARDVVAK
ncbi:hypothetical protein [Burkholderia multivorans]|uniref:hypothetical protein n=1 Tax=Burkholderia multivorans TaxID=87883 RepID=UPI0020B3ECDE|nr:hypothetical protein [Burkholderia multivorans]